MRSVYRDASSPKHTMTTHNFMVYYHEAGIGACLKTHVTFKEVPKVKNDNQYELAKCLFGGPVMVKVNSEFTAGETAYLLHPGIPIVF
jgi:hypothetical protein